MEDQQSGQDADNHPAHQQEAVRAQDCQDCHRCRNVLCSGECGGWVAAVPVPELGADRALWGGAGALFLFDGNASGLAGPGTLATKPLTSYADGFAARRRSWALPGAVGARAHCAPSVLKPAAGVPDERDQVAVPLCVPAYFALLPRPVRGRPEMVLRALVLRALLRAAVFFVAREPVRLPAARPVAVFFVVAFFAGVFFAAVFFAVVFFVVAFFALLFLAVVLPAARLRAVAPLRLGCLVLGPGRAPPSCLFTVAQARRSASFFETPCCS